jgi:hypothetical protein
VAELVKSHRSARFDQELLARYQVSIDNELHRAIRALREAQRRFRAIEGVVDSIEAVAKA